MKRRDLLEEAKRMKERIDLLASYVASLSEEERQAFMYALSDRMCLHCYGTSSNTYACCCTRDD